jgi:hypothetical protein
MQIDLGEVVGNGFMLLLVVSPDEVKGGWDTNGKSSNFYRVPATFCLYKGSEVRMSHPLPSRQ